MEEKKIKDHSTLSIVLGVVGILMCATIIGVIPAAIGLYFAVDGVERIKEKKKKFIVAIVLCVIGILLSIVPSRASKDSSGEKATTATEESKQESTTDGSGDADIEKAEDQPKDESATDNPDAEKVTDEKTEEEKKAELKKEKAKKKKQEKKFRESCEEYNYKDVLRNPDDYVGKKVKIEVKISSVHNESWLNSDKYYFARSREDAEDDYFWGDEYAVIDKREDTDDPKLLEDDVIMVYGTIAEPEETKSLILNSEEVFCIDMKYVDLLAE